MQPLADQQIRHNPAFARLVRARRIDQVSAFVAFTALIVIVILVSRAVIHNPFVPWIPVAVAATAAQLYARHIRAKAFDEISADPAVRRRALLLVKPWAETRYLRLLP